MILQTLLAFAVSGTRGTADTWVGDGGHEALLRLGRRLGNLAEYAGSFVAGFALLELSRSSPVLLVSLSTIAEIRTGALTAHCRPVRCIVHRGDAFCYRPSGKYSVSCASNNGLNPKCA